MNTITMIRVMKLDLQSSRVDKWETYLQIVKNFWVENSIEVPNKDGIILIYGRSKHE